MSLRRLVLVALLGGFACDEGTSPPDAAPEPSEPAQGVAPAQLEMPHAEICDMLPADGPCSLACDHAALATFVPAGTCAVFRCELVNGRQISVHACHPDD